MKKSIYDIVTEKITEQLEKGIVPWQQAWTTSGGFGWAISYTTRKPYSFLNQMLLGCRGGEYLTYNQAKKLGGHVKQGAKAGMVVFYQPNVIKVEVKDKEGNITYEEKEIPVLKSYNVFHIDDCEGIESKCTKVQGNTDNQPIEEAEAIVVDYVKRSGIKFTNNKQSNDAYYRPSDDSVVVPMITQYDIPEEYYSTTFHELVHSTGAKNRLNRHITGKAAFGSEDYSREELVAEIGSAMLCAAAGLDCEKAFKNSVAYIQDWAKKLKSDNHAIVWAASRAEKAAKYIKNEQ